MALKKLLARNKLDKAKRELEEARSKAEEVAERRAALETRSEEAETAIKELTEEASDEEREAVEQEVDEIEAEDEKVKEAEQEADEKIRELEKLIGELEEELDKEDAPEAAPEANHVEERTEIREETPMGKIRSGFFAGWERREAERIVKADEVRDFLENVREIGRKKNRAVSGAELLIPETLVAVLRDSIHRYSKLIGKVYNRQLKGRARVNTVGEIPEAVWTEACAKLNELDIVFGQYEVDGYKVGGIIPVCNALLEDSDINLANEIMDQIGQAIGLAIDKAILYGTGNKMPLGIVTRLAQTVQPDGYPVNAPEWKDLSTTHIGTAAGATGEELFSDLIVKTGVARSRFGTGGKFWAMNETTRALLMSKTVGFNAAGALVASAESTLPIVGGSIVVLPFIPDGDIIGGYGGQYLLVERKGIQLKESEHVQFIEDNTVFKGTARYDGLPIVPEGFVALNINGGTVTKEVAFAPDKANESQDQEPGA